LSSPGPRRRPGWWWLFFYGRRRRGFPGLLVGLLAAALLLGLTYRVPGGADVSRWLILLSGLVVALLAGLALALVVFAFLRPRGGR
jgi:hypothetical protein